MLELSGNSQVKKVERIRRSERLAHPDNTNIDYVKSKTIALTKREAAAKQAKQKLGKRKRQAKNSEGKARKSQRTTGTGTTERAHPEKLVRLT